MRLDSRAVTWVFVGKFWATYLKGVANLEFPPWYHPQRVHILQGSTCLSNQQQVNFWGSNSGPLFASRNIPQGVLPLIELALWRALLLGTQKHVDIESEGFEQGTSNFAHFDLAVGGQRVGKPRLPSLAWETKLSRKHFQLLLAHGARVPQCDLSGHLSCQGPIVDSSFGAVLRVWSTGHVFHMPEAEGLKSLDLLSRVRFLG